MTHTCKNDIEHGKLSALEPWTVVTCGLQDNLCDEEHEAEAKGDLEQSYQPLHVNTQAGVTHRCQGMAVFCCLPGTWTCGNTHPGLAGLRITLQFQCDMPAAGLVRCCRC
jgi:hypothetical protein